MTKFVGFRWFVHVFLIAVIVLTAVSCNTIENPPGSQPVTIVQKSRLAKGNDGIASSTASRFQPLEGDAGMHQIAAVLPATQTQGGVFPDQPFNGLQLEYSVSGGQLESPVDEEGFTWSRKQNGRLTGKTVVVSGVAHAESGWGATLTVRLSAQGVEPLEYTKSKFPEHGLYPANAEPDPMNQPFNVSLDIPAGAEWVDFSIDLTGDFNAGGRSVVISGRLAGLQWPCSEPKFFYPGMSLEGYFSGHPPLRFSQEQMKTDLVAALQRFINEGNEVVSGVGFTDVHSAAKAFITSALPTGKEKALQDAARQLAREKQQADPNYRLTPGDFFYLSLKANNGNVRDALFTAHAALYRDSQEINKQFIEQENILTPLRDPEGYVDGEYQYTTPQGKSRSINPRQELSGDEQGVWYHFFGLATLEFTDEYGYGSYYAARLAIWGGALQSNYSDKVIQRGFPTSNLGGALGDLAIALEDNVRTNMGKPPDIAKYCINYYALAAGNGLKEAMWLNAQPNPFKDWDTPRNLPFSGDILQPTGVVIYKSPLSVMIEGSDGEWFYFDQRSGQVDGNTPLLYFEIFPEEDGTLGFLGMPFFDVASIQLTGSGVGPVTLGLYDSATKSSGVYEFEIHDGDEVLIEGLTATPTLNYVTLEATAQESGGVLTGLQPGISIVFWLIIGCGGLLFLFVILSLVVIFKRRRPRPDRSALAQTLVTGGNAPWQLAVREGVLAQQEFLLAEIMTLGRGQDNDIQLDDQLASRHHARIGRENGCYFIEDLGSSNGTLVNQQRIRQKTTLRAGDKVKIGRTVFELINPLQP